MYTVYCIVYIGSRQNNNSVIHNHKNVLYYDICRQRPHITSYHLMIIYVKISKIIKVPSHY